MVVKNRQEMAMKAKRIVYQLTKQLEKCSVEDDFQQVLLATPMKRDDLEVGYSAFLELHEEIRSALRNGQSVWLDVLTEQQKKHVLQMLNNKNKSSSPSQRARSSRRVKVEENDHDPVQIGIGREKLEFKIPQLDFGFNRLQEHQEEEEEEEIECVSGKPRSSCSPREPEPEPDAPSEPTPRITVAAISKNKIASRPRPVPRNDQGMQTDEVEAEVPVRIETADQGTSCDLLLSPRPLLEHSELPMTSPTSTVTTELSEGEVAPRAAADDVIVPVSADGSIVWSSCSDEHAYFGESESDILRATSASPLRVAERELSVSSTPH